MSILARHAGFVKHKLSEAKAPLKEGFGKLKRRVCDKVADFRLPEKRAGEVGVVDGFADNVGEFLLQGFFVEGFSDGFANQIFHNDIDAIFMEISVITE